MDFSLDEYQLALVRLAEDLAQREFAPQAYAWEERGEYPYQYLKTLADVGLTGLAIPADKGGQGGRLMDAVLVMEAIGRVCPSAADCLYATNFAAVQQIAHLGSPAVIEQQLNPLLSGQGLVSVAISEPEAGSDVAALRTRARVEGDEVVLNGAKLFNNNGPFSTRWVVWARFGESPREIGVVLVEKGTPGVTVQPARFMSGEQYATLFFDDCRIPAGNILTQQGALRQLMPIFNIERLGNAARSLAAGDAALAMAVEHARQRTQFGHRLAEFQGLQWRIAEMKLKLEGARLLLYRAAANADAGRPSALESSMAKLACNRAGFDVANEALQILGGTGFSAESRVSSLFRRTRGWLIAGGTAEQMLNRIASEVLGER